MRVGIIFVAVSVFLMSGVLCAYAEVREEKINDVSFITFVSNEAWQPEGFDEAPLLRAALAEQAPAIDGLADDPAWARAESLTLPLTYGTVKEATLKAVYTEKDVFLLVSWPDPSKDDQHHPWLWDAEQGRYVEGPQVEDGLLVSIEAGCDWNAHLLTGYVYDFDGWRWLAARTNPIGQAVDTSGHVQDRWRKRMGYTKYQGREQKPFWNMKLTGRGPGILTKTWQELDRVYLFLPIRGGEVFVSMEPDGRPVPAFITKLPAPSIESELEKAPHGRGPGPDQAAQTPLPVVPQFKPVKLTGDAGEVAAKGYWADGRWTVEYRRARVTPARTATDSVLDRTTQFSIHVFDRTERVDEASESGRILLQFEPAGEWPAIVENTRPTQ